ncbi:hypothetical protein NM208_g11189 [Fusarium decemcellulare]|uniref:Uncharacterized protein n=1 Tax=Fusarium decemcellulare TaxID=57161 RepID=A0ACC1RV67_9HYPO|nr:hypothetical protein NM208_g11189 [Fusarium decemcellulare]
MASTYPNGLNGNPASTPIPTSTPALNNSEPQYISDSSSSEGEDYTDEAEDRLEHIKTSKVINLPIRSTYTRWGPVAAFRELVQNWRDAIITSFNLAESEFIPIREERSNGRNTEIIYKIWKPNSEPKEWLGFIRFNAHDGKGTVEITNRGGSQ